jgi:anti-sigma factor RsiW
MTSHPSRITLERHSVDDLPPPERDEVERHAGACGDCRAYLGELREAAAAHRAAPPELFVARVRARRVAELRRARGIGVGIAVALAAAAGIAIFVTHPDPAAAPDEVTLKGGGVAVHRRRGDAVAPLGERDRVRAGDALRFVVTLERPGRATAWVVDDAGRIDAIASRVELPAGGAPLPDAVEIEAPCRDSVLVVATGDLADRWTERDVRAQPSLRPGGPGSPPPGILAIAISCER